MHRTLFKMPKRFITLRLYRIVIKINIKASKNRYIGRIEPIRKIRALLVPMYFFISVLVEVSVGYLIKTQNEYNKNYKTEC